MVGFHQTSQIYYSLNYYFIFFCFSSQANVVEILSQAMLLEMEQVENVRAEFYDFAERELGFIEGGGGGGGIVTFPNTPYLLCDYSCGAL